ncbi:hypothetical protein IAG25_35585 [Caballeronia sp. EK]|uniref:hypothetical protein n=1 Tax=Caballeronia sp. EK TaxID=2767469 RepID=UPI00165605FA|nr:hypothetical protein [Caballeronia sp. EK]MBC8642130.1 hypothetical protein [Caballeronia sp. EK]
MDINFSVALDSPAQERDFAFQAGDDFKLAMKVYATDSADDIDAEDLSGKTLTFEILGYPSRTMTATGNTFTFDTPLPDKMYIRARMPFRIVMTDADGLRTTLCFGHMIARGGCKWPRWLSGTDYGWRA